MQKIRQDGDGNSSISTVTGEAEKKNSPSIQLPLHIPPSPPPDSIGLYRDIWIAAIA